MAVAPVSYNQHLLLKSRDTVEELLGAVLLAKGGVVGDELVGLAGREDLDLNQACGSADQILHLHAFHNVYCCSDGVHSVDRLVLQSNVSKIVLLIFPDNLPEFIKQCSVELIVVLLLVHRISRFESVILVQQYSHVYRILQDADLGENNGDRRGRRLRILRFFQFLLLQLRLCQPWGRSS